MVDVVKLIPNELEVDSLYSVRVRTLNAFGAPSAWSESLVVDTNVGFRRFVWTDNGPVYYFENGKVLFSLYESDLVRINYVKNPSFENGLTGWDRIGTTEQVTPTVVNTDFLYGDYSCKVKKLVPTTTAEYGIKIAQTHLQPTVPGESWTASAFIKHKVYNTFSTLRPKFYNASYAPIASPGNPSAGNLTSGANSWFKGQCTVAAPAGAAWVGIEVVFLATPLNVINVEMYVDGVMLQKNVTTTGSYFDGNMGGGFYWGGLPPSDTGTPHNSVSYQDANASLVTVNKDVYIGGSYDGSLSVFKQEASKPTFFMDSSVPTWGSRDGANLTLADVNGVTQFEIHGQTGTATANSVKVVSGGLKIVGGHAFMEFYSGSTAGSVQTPGTRSGYFGFYPDDEIQLVNEMANGYIHLTVNGTGEIRLTGTTVLSKAPTQNMHAATKQYVDSTVFIPEIYTVASQAAMLALPATRGDYALRTDVSKTFILKVDPASTLGNWAELPSDASAAADQAVADHVALTDPHTQYLTETSANTLYTPLTRTITTDLPLTGGGSLAANRTFGINIFTVSTSGAVPTGGGSSANYLRGNATWANPHSQTTIDTYFRSGQFVTGGAGAIPTKQISFSYNGAIDSYRHEILSSHNSAGVNNNQITFRLWQPGDPAGGAPTNTVITLEGTRITAYKPITLPADPVNLFDAATKQYVDNLSSTSLDELYVNVAGDTMTGHLQLGLNLYKMTYGDLSTDTTGMRLNTNAVDKSIRFLINGTARLTISNTSFAIPINTTINPGALDFGARFGQHINLNTNSTYYGVGAQTFNTYLRTANGFRFYQNGVHDDVSGSPGVGGVELFNITSTSAQFKGRNVATELWVQSRGENLVSNGSGHMLDNTNFSTFVYNPYDSYTGPGSFTYDGADSSREIDEMIPVDYNKKYKFSYAIKLLAKTVGTETPNHYGYVASYDADRQWIQPQMVYKFAGATPTTLAVTLNPGATTITLTNATGWCNTSTAGNKWIAFYPYTNAQGYVYQNYTYTRNLSANGDMWAANGIAANVITLRSPWSGASYPAGTPVSNAISAANHDYIAGNNVDTPINWTVYEGGIGKWSTDPLYDPYTTPGERYCVEGFLYGTAFVRPGWQLSYDTPAGTAKSVIDAVDFRENTQSTDHMYFSAPQGTPPFYVLSTTRVDNLNADLLDGIDSAGYIQAVGGGTISAGNLNITTSQLTFGSHSGQQILLSGTNHVIGIQGPGGVGQDTIYNRSPNAFYWYRGGTHSNVAGTAGSGGVALLAMSDVLFTYKDNKIWTAADNGHTDNNTGINADRLDDKHAVYFANKEEMEALMGDLLYVGTYDAQSYLSADARYLPFNAAIPNTITGWSYDPPTDASVDLRLDFQVPAYASAQRPIAGTGTPFMFHLSGTQVVSYIRASDNSLYSVTSSYPSEIQTVTPSTPATTPAGLISGGTFTITFTGIGGSPITTGNIQWNATAANVKTAINTAIPGNTITVAGGPVNTTAFTLTFPNSYGVVPLISVNVGNLTSTDPLLAPRLTPSMTALQTWIPNARIQLRAVWDKTNDTLTHYWRISSVDLFDDVISSWNLLGTATHAGKLLWEAAAPVIIGGQSTYYYTGNMYRVGAKTNNILVFDFKGSDVPPEVGPPETTTTFVSSSGHTLTMVGTGMVQDQLLPDPDWSGGSYVYRNGMYWVVSSPGAVDFITTDTSGRYESGDPTKADEQIELANGDWVIATIPGYAVTTKRLLNNVAILTLEMPDTLPPTTKHNLAVGAVVNVSDVDDIFDGAYTITSITDTTINYTRINDDIASTQTTGIASGETLDQVIFQYIPFSTETYVKSQILAHTAEPNPHPQYLREADANARYSVIGHGHDAEIRQRIFEHILTDEWPVSAWEWDPITGFVTLTVGLRAEQAHNIVTGGSFELANVHAQLNRKWPTHHTEVIVDSGTGAITYKVVFEYITVPPLTPPVDYPITSPATVISTPNGKISNDPHEQYLEKIEGDILYSPFGHNHDLRYAPIDVMVIHKGEIDPHTQYLTEVEGNDLFLTEGEGNSLYSLLGHVHDPTYEIHATDGATSSEVWIGDQQPTVIGGLSVGDIWIETAPITLQSPSKQILTVNNAVSGLAINISWTPWPAEELISAISLQRSTDAVNWGAPIVTDEFVTSFTDTAVSYNSRYYYRINATNQHSSGQYSTIAGVITKPTVPTSVAAASTNYNNASVSWNAPAGGAGYIYEVFVNNVSVGQKSSPYSHTGVTENTAYTFGVRALSTLSQLVSNTVNSSVTTGYSAPVQPTSITVTAINHNSASVSWPASTSSNRKDYEVFLNTTSKGHTTALSYSYTGLSASTSYTFKVRTRSNDDIYSPTRDTTGSTTAPPDTSPPTSPTFTSFKPEGSYGRMVARFTLKGDTAGYRIDYSTNSGNVTYGTYTAHGAGDVAIVVGTWANHTWSNVWCRVYAFDSVGNYSWDDSSYQLIDTPTYITATGTNHWRANNTGNWNAMGTYRVVQGYYNNSAYNAIGCWFYGTKPYDELYYSGRRTITGGGIYMRRGDGGAGVELDITLYLHYLTTNPGNVASGAAQPSIDGGIVIDADLQWQGVGKTITFPQYWASYLVSGLYKGVAIHKSNGSNYMTLYNLTEDGISGRLEIDHYG